jgi:hypothetical protein
MNAKKAAQNHHLRSLAFICGLNKLYATKKTPKAKRPAEAGRFLQQSTA